MELVGAIHLGSAYSVPRCSTFALPRAFSGAEAAAAPGPRVPDLGEAARNRGVISADMVKGDFSSLSRVIEGLKEPEGWPDRPQRSPRYEQDRDAWVSQSWVPGLRIFQPAEQRHGWTAMCGEV